MLRRETNVKGRLAVVGVAATELRSCLLGLQSPGPFVLVGDAALKFVKRVMSAFGTAEKVLRSPMAVSSRLSVIPVSSPAPLLALPVRVPFFWTPGVLRTVALSIS